MDSIIKAVSWRIQLAVALACLLAAIGGAPSLCRAQGLSEKNPRLDKIINSGWKFIRQDVAGAQASDFDDQRWQPIDLPHTWNAKDGQDGGTYYQGPGWYRKHLMLSRKTAGAGYFLKFTAPTAWPRFT